MSSFEIIKKSKISQARVSELKTPHGTIEGPFFMPIATRGVLKNLTGDELKDLGAQIILANTYHLMLRPGIEIIKKAGGLHKFMGWDGPILTDSGGYQIFSLNSHEFFSNKSRISTRIKTQIKTRMENVAPSFSSDKRPDRIGSHLKNLPWNDNDKVGATLPEIKITDKGVIFRSELDGEKIFLSPEKAIEVQLALGSDIMMVLDECVPYPCDYEKAKKAVERTTKWARRSMGIMNHESGIKRKSVAAPFRVRFARRRLKSAATFGIIQGSVYKDLRIQSAKEITALNFDGYAIGGVAVGEPREKFWKVLDWVIPYLPENKPRYLMGLGRPEEIVQAVKMGIDMFDCVIPTRNARHGTLYKSKNKKAKIKNKMLNVKCQMSDVGFYEILHITNEKFKKDFSPVDKNCSCYTCQHYSRAYLRHLFMLGEPLGLRLATIHNLAFYLGLMKEIREAIEEDKL